MTSVTRWLVSTLPPTTAASSLGLSRQPAGIVMVTGERQPCKTAFSTRRVDPFLQGTAVFIPARMHGGSSSLSAYHQCKEQSVKTGEILKALYSY